MNDKFFAPNSSLSLSERLTCINTELHFSKAINKNCISVHKAIYTNVDETFGKNVPIIVQLFRFVCYKSVQKCLALEGTECRVSDPAKNGRETCNRCKGELKEQWTTQKLVCIKWRHFSMIPFTRNVIIICRRYITTIMHEE